MSIQNISVAVGAGAILSLAWFAYVQSTELQPINPGTTSPSFSEVEIGFDDAPESLPLQYKIGKGKGYTLQELQTWVRPEGPTRVGLQSGHLDNDQVPEELAALERNGGGASFGNLTEREVVYIITELVAAELRAAGIEVDVLPATVPPGYVADAFVSIHADGNTNSVVNGFKHAAPRRDYSGQSADLVAALYETYGEATGLRIDPSITNRMTAYYAFNWPRYEHAIHPFTPAAIVETGFLTSAVDRAIIVDQPEKAAKGIAEGIKKFLAETSSERRTIPFALNSPTFPLSGEVACAPLRTERIRQGATSTCPISLKTVDDRFYLLEFPDTVATSTLTGTLSVTGQFIPLQTLDNYFWFRYEAAGIIRVDTFKVQ